MSTQTVSPHAVADQQRQGRSMRVIDVRTPAEYARLHADSAELLPLDQLDPGKLAIQSAGHPLYIICKSGGRAAIACDRLTKAGMTNVFSIEGGTDAWRRAGLPIVEGNRRVISLERQVRIGAGLLVLLGVTLGWFLHPALYGLAAFVGAGLVFAGITNWCGMGMVLSRMPWNRC
jgi:rhodanese-related sulfurtransferase